MVVDPGGLVAEILGLEKKGVAIRNRLLVSSNAHLTLNVHKKLDGIRESSSAQQKIGTTLRGIGPAYADKANRNGIRAADLRHPAKLREKLKHLVGDYNRYFEALGTSSLNFDDEWEELRTAAHFLAPMVSNTVYAINKAFQDGKNLLFEGAQGTMLDIDHGTYPFVTSSNTTVGSVCTGAGLAPKHVGAVIGVTKAYSTRVGGGPFPTELHGEAGESLREIGAEYGATTGRPPSMWVVSMQSQPNSPQ